MKSKKKKNTREDVLQSLEPLVFSPQIPCLLEEMILKIEKNYKLSLGF